MVCYVDSSTQTVIAGLSRHPAPVPAVLSYHTDASTPPDDMPSKELQLQDGITPTFRTNLSTPAVSPTLLLRRKNRHPLVARISLPPNEFSLEPPLSPPSTLVAMSPLPAVNTLHAGHTPIFPRSLSPSRMHGRDDCSWQSTPDQEEVLTGPLTLPSQPGDGTADHIELQVLDAELERIAKKQDMASRQSDMHSSPPLPAELGGLEPQAKSTQRSSENDVEFVDGVILKPAKMNFGQPLGQA